MKLVPSIVVASIVVENVAAGAIAVLTLLAPSAGTVAVTVGVPAVPVEPPPPEATTCSADSTGESAEPAIDWILRIPSETVTLEIVRTSAAFGPTSEQMSRLEMSGLAAVSTMSNEKIRLPLQGAAKNVSAK